MKDVERVVKSFNERIVDGQSLVVIATDEINESQRQTIISITGDSAGIVSGLSDFIGEKKELMALAMVVNKMETKKNNNE